MNADAHAIEPTPIEIALGEPTWQEEHLVGSSRSGLHGSS